MNFDVGFIGFGEAAEAIVSGWRETDAGVASDLSIAAYDILFDDPLHGTAKRNDCKTCEVSPLASAAELAACSGLVFSAVTADQVLNAATSVAEHLRPDAAYLDINSAAPNKKRRAAQIIQPRCSGYVDVAVLSPVYAKRHQTPLAIGGPGVARCLEFLGRMEMRFEVVSDEVGPASMLKMIRSAFVKGLESVTFECAVAAHKAGIADQVFPSLANVLRFTDVKEQADYMMERVAVHGKRRAAEMREVAETLADLGVASIMSEAAARQQQSVGELNLREIFAGEVPADAKQISAHVIKARK